MPTDHYEAFAYSAIKQAANEKREQPWKSTVDTQAAPGVEEWVEVAGVVANDDHTEVDVRKQAFPMGDVDIRKQAFPMGDVDVRKQAFPMGSMDIRTNAFPMGEVNGLTHIFP